MRLDDKKFTEMFVLSQLRELYKEFPSGIIKSGESPDFLLKITPRKSIGIEITRVFHRDIHGVIDTESDLRTVFMEQLKARLRDFLPIGVWICLRFNHRYLLSPENFLSNLIGTTVAMRKAILAAREQKSIRLLPIKKLPPALLFISLGIMPDREAEIWEIDSEPLPASQFCDLVKERIFAKEGKAQLYHKKRVHQLWLLLYAFRVPKGAAEYFRTYPFSVGNHWERIILLELENSKLYELSNGDRL